MQNPFEYYTSEKIRLEKELKILKRKLNISSSLRLFLFAFIAFGIYFFFGKIYTVLGIGLVGIILFLFLISRHSNLEHQRDFLNLLIEIHIKEIQILDRNFRNYNSGKKYINPKHAYSFDIDLFGIESFFQYVNRTVTKNGEKEFAKLLTANCIENIPKKQKAIQELANIPSWRHDFSALGNLMTIQNSIEEILQWIQNYKSVMPKNSLILQRIFSGISIALGLFVLFNPSWYPVLILWFFVGLGISGYFVKKASKIYEDSDKAKETFTQYYQLLQKIEEANFTTEILVKKQKSIQTESQKASMIFKKFSKILESFDQRNNLIIALFGSGFLLRDLLYANKVEDWINSYQHKIEDWFDAITYFDAQNSLANFAFNHPQFVFPKINSDQNTIETEHLGHPLMDVNSRIDNNFKIENQQFFIITGANMAGKSTFLRTVSLAIVMANMGLPVCAKSFHYSPIKLIISMRTSDSLAEDESYFFSELKRLKFIVEEIKKDNYFIILDEILKGTNSVDKAIGSKKFVQKLVASNSTGIIATHDLSLCEIENELSAIKNYYFDAEIIDDELHFDYQLKTGVCKNMNASFLLKKMEIV